MSGQQTPSQPMRPSGINHLVLNVRDMEESHRFWTEIIGFQQVGELKPRPEFPGVKMRFYSGDHDGSMNHHDLALVENKDLPKPPRAVGLVWWSERDQPCRDNISKQGCLAETTQLSAGEGGQVQPAR